jgi:hypothetical protein
MEGSSGMSLTARATIKLRALQDAEDDAHTVLLGVQRRLSEISQAAGYGAGDTANLEHEAARLSGRVAELQGKHQHLANLSGQIRHWLTKIGANRATEDAKLPKVKLAKGETHTDMVNRIRDDIASALKERLNVQQAGLPIEEMRAQVRKWISEQARKGRPRVIASHDGFRVEFDDGRGFVPGGDWGAVLCWLFEEGMTEELEKIVEAMPAPPLALTPSEKAERLAANKVRLLELERQEEAVIDAAARDGLDISRRPNADPAAILGVTIVNRREAAA